MHGTKVEVAFRRHVGDIHGDAFLLAEGVNGGGCEGVVDGGEHHCDCGVVEIGWEEVAVDVGDEVLRDAVGDFGDEAGGGGDDGDEGVGVEQVEDAAGGDLHVRGGFVRARGGIWRGGGSGGGGGEARFRRPLQGHGGCGLARREGGSRRAGPRGIRRRADPLGDEGDIYIERGGGGEQRGK